MTSDLLLIVIPFNPVPASRPRLSRFGGVHYSKAYTQWRKDAYPWAVKQAVGQLFQKDDALAFEADHIIAKPRTSKLTHPKPDVDNLLKATMDLITHMKLWEDDQSVVQVTSTKRFCVAPEQPRTEVRIWKL